MKGLLASTGIAMLLHKAVPSDGWLIIFVLFICLFGCWMCHDMEESRS